MNPAAVEFKSNMKRGFLEFSDKMFSITNNFGEDGGSPGHGPIKIIFSVILRYAGFERSDWLKKNRKASQNS